jgi:predicted double-glycine peptidase
LQILQHNLETAGDALGIAVDVLTLAPTLPRRGLQERFLPCRGRSTDPNLLQRSRRVPFNPSIPSTARRRERVGALATVFALLCAGCHTQSLKPELMSRDAVVLDLPMLHQDELYECGFVSISALCQYYHVEIPAAQRSELIRIAHERKGLSGAELRDALERLDMEVYIFPGTLDHSDTGLYHHADAGRPLLVMRSTNGETSHYCLLLGYDEPMHNVFLLDPVQGRISTPAQAFENEWRRTDHFTLLAFPARTASLAARESTSPAPRESVSLAPRESVNKED